MLRKKYNWKSRQVVNTVIDDSSTKKIQLDLPFRGHYDESNELVLPSAKRQTRVKSDKKTPVRILSKRHRKRLEKIVDKKKKKENRAGLLEALSKVQAAPSELVQLTSLASVQTKGLKRHFREQQNGPKDPAKRPKGDATESDYVEPKINILSGSKRRLVTTTLPPTKLPNDPNVLGLDNHSDSDDSESDNEPTVEPVTRKPTVDSKSVEPVTVISEPLPRRPAVYVDVIRDPQIQESRLKLPILSEEQQIMETISEHSIVIIAGETGSGKTTQLPQFLYEAGYAREKTIAVTEPRRVAAIAMSKRVALEMNLSDREVSYLIRFEGNVTDDTRIKFMTDGVLLKEIQSDFLLSRYSVVVLDEAHERSVYTDILIGLLSRIVPMRAKRGEPLKLVIMSATLRIDDFTSNQRLFKVTPPVISVDSRQFPVTIHFNKRTIDNYLQESYSKAVKVHTKLPEGGILMFLTGQEEVNYMVKKLRKKFPFVSSKRSVVIKVKDDRQPDTGTTGKSAKQKKVVIPKVNLDSYETTEDLSDDDDDDDGDDKMADGPQCNSPMWVLPLYSLLTSHKQNRVFEAPPAGCRLCIVATNVAETSLTIPNVKYVIDCGRSKVKLYDKITGVTSHVVTWTSKASANQRAGRAGRTAPGHCYRLYSSALFNDTFPPFSPPEIQQKPVDDLYLQMKALGIDRVVNFPFPTAPDLHQLKGAAHRLEILGALSGGKVTELGRAIAKFPVLPRFGKMLALSHQHDLLPYTVALVAALSVQEVLLERPIGESVVGESRARWWQVRRQWAGSGDSYKLGDNMVLLRAVGSAEFANCHNELSDFCSRNGLRLKALLEIRKLRLQLTNEINANLPDCELVVDPRLEPPTDLQARLLRQILLAGLGDQLARRTDKMAYRANDMEDEVYLNSSSVFKRSPPDLVVYQEIYEVKGKMLMRGVTAVEPDWLPTYVPHLCNLGDPLTDPEPTYREGRVYCTVTGTFGTQAWELPKVEVVHPRTANYYKYFAKFLLEGLVFVKLAKYRGVLLSQPGIMVKSWARLQSRTDCLWKCLVGKDVDSRDRLEEIWRDEDPKFLLFEYLKWVPESAQSEVSLMWPPLD